MTTGTPGPGQQGSAAPEPQDTATRHADAMHSLNAEVDRLRRNLDTASLQSENSQTVLKSNRRIGMAIGILLERLHVTEEQAFELLREESMRQNVRLAQVAEQVVYTGTL